MAEDDGYVCSLTEASLKKAKEELNEDPKERLAAVAQLREWILQQPHIKTPTDTLWLLSFLRTAKFSQLKARNILTGYMTCKTEVAPRWYNDIDTTDKKIQDFYSSGYILPLPGVDHNGWKVYLIQEGAIETDFKKYGVDDIFRACFAASLRFQDDENTQVNGIMYISDFSQYSILHQDIWSLDIMKKSMKCWMNNFPSRYKGFYMYNHGALVEALMVLFKPLLSAKMKSRMHMLGSNLEALYKIVPMHMLPKEYLPDDYSGPCVGTIKEMTDNFKAEMTSPEVRERIKYISRPEWGMDKSKKPVEVEQASFRKLNIDD